MSVRKPFNYTARSATLFFAALILTCALAENQRGRVKRQLLGSGNIINTLGGLASSFIPALQIPQGLTPQGLLQQLQGGGDGLQGGGLQGIGLPVLVGPQAGGGGYGEYFPGVGSILGGIGQGGLGGGLGGGLPSLGVRGSLETLLRQDTRRCIPRLVCEFAAGQLPNTFRALAAVPASNPTYARTSSSRRQDDLGGVDDLIGLLTLVAGGESGGTLNVPGVADTPLKALGRAALLGTVSRGRPNVCTNAYPACPRDPERLLLYLNNHRGGLFQLFSGPPGLYDGYYRNQLRQNEEARGRALAATPSDALPAEHRGVTGRRRRRDLRFPEDEDSKDNEVANDGTDNSLGEGRILHLDISKNPVRFPSDGAQTRESEDSKQKLKASRMRFPRDFKDSGGRIVGVFSSSGSNQEEIVAEGHEFDPPQRPSLSFGGTHTSSDFAKESFGNVNGVYGDGGEFPKDDGNNGGFGADEYIITSGGNEFPLAPGQKPEDFEAPLSSHSQGSLGLTSVTQRPFVTNNPYNQYLATTENPGYYQRPYTSNNHYQQPNAVYVTQRPSGFKVNFRDDLPQQSRPTDFASSTKGTRQGRDGFGSRLRFPKDGEVFNSAVTPRPFQGQTLKTLPMVFPDRTGTGDLRLDFNELHNGYRDYKRPLRGVSTKVTFPGRFDS